MPYARSKTKKTPSSVICERAPWIERYRELLMKMRQSPKNRLFQGALLNSLVATSKPNLLKTRSTIKSIIPAFRKGSRATKKDMTSGSVTLDLLKKWFAQFSDH